MKRMNNFQITKISASGCCLAFAWFFSCCSLALLMKVLPKSKKKRVNLNIEFPSEVKKNIQIWYSNRYRKKSYEIPISLKPNEKVNYLRLKMNLHVSKYK